MTLARTKGISLNADCRLSARRTLTLRRLCFATDDRRDYGEVRWQALGLLDGRLHMLVFVETAAGIRVISFRKANQREVKRHEKATRS